MGQFAQWPLLRCRQTLHALALAVCLASGFSTGLSLPASAQSNAQAVRFYEQGIQAYNRGNNTEAIRAFEQAVQSDKSFLDAWYNLGSVQFRAKNYDKARAAFDRALQLNPSDQQARFNLALSLENLGRTEDALKIYQGIPKGTVKYDRAQQKIASLQSTLNQKAKTPDVVKPTTPSTPVKVSEGVREARPFAKALAGPTGMTLGPRGEVFVANYSKNNIVRIDGNGKQTIVTEGGDLGGPIGLVRDPRTGNLYVANYIKGTILRVMPDGKTSPLATGLQKPYNLLLDTLSNSLYVSEQGTNSVSQIRL